MTMEEFKTQLTEESALLVMETQKVVDLITEAAAVTADGMEVANFSTARMLMDGLNARLSGADLKSLAGAANAIARLAKETVEPEGTPEPAEEPVKPARPKRTDV